MIRTVNFQELERCLEEGQFREYKLCYIDDLAKTCWDYTPGAKAYRDYCPNPDYIPGSQTLSAFFTPIPLDDQWGDDWDDAPYEHNAGAPYDSDYGEKGERLEIELLEVLFYLPKNGRTVRFPCDYGGGNSPFCVRDINGGAVAWVYYRKEEWKSNKGSIAIHAGCNPAEFMEKVLQIQEAVGPWEPEDEEE